MFQDPRALSPPPPAPLSTPHELHYLVTDLKATSKDTTAIRL